MSAPSLEDIIDAGIETALGAVETAQIGLVTSFDSTHHTVNVQPMAMKEVEREEGRGVVELIKQPIIPNVPIWFMGAGGARFTFPVKKGSTVLLVHLSHAKAAWQFSDGTRPFDPGDTRRHALTDCVAIPGGLTSLVAAKKVTASIQDNAVIIHTPGKIYLGGGDTEPVLKADSFLAALDILIAAIASSLGGIYPTTGAAAGVLVANALDAFSGTVRSTYKSSVTESE